MQRLHADLIYCYKILFGFIDELASNFFEKAPLSIHHPRSQLQALQKPFYCHSPSQIL